MEVGIKDASDRLDVVETGATPADGSVTNAKVATGAAISADKLANGTTNKVYTATEQAKLAGIASAATANSTDATLLARANHTGTQAAGTITGLATIATSGSASDLATGTVGTARLGSGTASSTTFLRGDNTWATPSGGSSGSTLTVYNVKTDYSAAGNGSTNDATAIQNALTAAGAAGGGIVYLPPGTYVVAKYLVIPSNVTLMGAGMGVSVLKSSGSTFRTAGGVAPDGGGYSILQATGATRVNIAVQDLTVDGNESADRTALAASGVRLSSFLVDMRNVTGLRLERVATRNTWTYNIFVTECTKFIVTQCDVLSPPTTGVYDQLDGIHILGSNRGRIVGNYVDNTNGADADDALVAHTVAGSSECYELVYANNTVRGGANANSLQIAGDTVAIRDITISNNVLWGGPGGLTMQWFSGAGGATIRGVTISNNVINTTIGGGIEIICNGGGHFEQVAITANVIDGYGAAGNPTAVGIMVSGGNSAKGLAVTGNVIRNGYFGGIELVQGSPVRDYTITGNEIDLSAAPAAAPVGIKLGSSLDGVCANNVVTGKATTAGTGILMTSTTGATATNQVVSGNRVRAFATGVSVSNAGGNNPTNTIFTSNITQGNGTATNFGTATVTTTGNL
jgi:hypothetical protein